MAVVRVGGKCIIPTIRKVICGGGESIAVIWRPSSDLFGA